MDQFKPLIYSEKPCVECDRQINHSPWCRIGLGIVPPPEPKKRDEKLARKRRDSKNCRECGKVGRSLHLQHCSRSIKRAQATGRLPFLTPCICGRTDLDIGDDCIIGGGWWVGCPDTDLHHFVAAAKTRAGVFKKWNEIQFEARRKHHDPFAPKGGGGR